MNYKKLFLVPASILLLALTGCGGENAESKSAEQIMSEEGVPVKTQTVTIKPFQKYYSFYSKLSGIKEATKGALIGGKIERIRARVGDFVSKDQIIVEFDETNPGVQFEQAKSAYSNAEKTFTRMKTLLAAGETAQANYDGAETQYLVAKRNYESLKQMLYIEAPFAGTLVDVKVNEGDNVKSESHLFTVAQLSKMRARVWASESEINIIKKGMTAEMNYNGSAYTGKVVDVSLASDPYKQAFYAEVEFDNPKRELKSGVTADIKVLTYNNPSAVVISRNLIMKDDKGNFVFVEKESKAEKRYINNGNDSGLDFEIKEGLNKGDKLIVQGNALLSDGTKVKVIQ